jgi:hypothetical protein
MAHTPSPPGGVAERYPPMSSVLEEKFKKEIKKSKYERIRKKKEI